MLSLPYHAAFLNVNHPMRYIFFLIIHCQLVVSPALAQGQRPKIGLVLSGGAAKGMAHVGALKVLEEEGIRPDYITGTSMGALVGALYAMGYEAAELEEILRNLDWDEVLTNEISLNNIAIEEKPYYGRYLIDLPLEQLKVQLPSGAIEGQKLSELFSRLTVGVHDISQFQNLPTPFAAVAVDLTTGKPIILDSGLLPEAMRASMAIPTVFTPVETDSSLLVDGGLARNFPVEEVLNMGADVVIGINVSSGFLEKDQINSLVDVLVESSFLFSNRDTEEQSKAVDVLIEPDLGPHTAADFKTVQPIIDSGYVAAAKHRAALRHLADSLNLRPVNKPQRFNANQPLLVKQIRIEGNEKVSSLFIRNKMPVRNSVISIDTLEQALEELYGTRYFTKITYSLHPVQDQPLLADTIARNRTTPEVALQLKVQEAPDAFLKPALHYDTENGAGFLLSYFRRNLLLRNSRLVAELDFSETPRAHINVFKYLGNKKALAGVAGADYLFNEISNGIINNEQVLARYDNSWFNPYLRLQSSKFQDFTIGLEGGWEYARVNPTADAVQPLSNNQVFDLSEIRRFAFSAFQLGAFLSLNTLNDPFYATDGMKLNARFERTAGTSFTPLFVDSLAGREQDFASLFNFDNTFRASLELEQYQQLGNSIALISLVAAGWNSANRLTPLDYTRVGGFYPLMERSIPFWGVRPYELSLADYALLREEMRVEVYPNFFAEAAVNLLLPNVFQLREDPVENQNILGYGAGVSYRSIMGPIRVTLAHQHNTNQWLGFFSLGFNFR